MIYNSDNNATIEQIGGKAFNLTHLHHTDVLVPQWIVLSSDIFFDFLGADMKQYTNLLENYSDEKRQLITELISKKDFSSEAKAKIIKEIKSVFAEADLVSVRSSATDEDGVNFSFAGMLESYLNVPSDEKIFDYIKKCYLSCFSECIMEYRKSNNLINRSISVAVIIQKMISPDYSGVIFTSNPVTNNPDEILVSIVKGLGEKLVSGNSDSIDYVIDRTETITSNSEKKESGINEKLLLDLYNISMTIEKSYTPRRALDIEFCIKDEQIYILQSRLITTYSFVDKDKFRTILDNSNIIESYSGVTTPLTFTFAKDVYSKIYKQTLKSFYVPYEAIKSIENDLDNMLAFYENKIYYRLNSWYKMTALYPGYEKNKKYMEKMMGVKTLLHEDKTQSKTRMIRIYVSLIRKFISMKKHSRQFLEKFNRVTKPYYGIDFDGYSNLQLINVYETLEKEILDDFITPIANDMGAMVFYGILTDKLKKANIPNYEGLLSSVLSKQGNVESAQQSAMLLKIVMDIKNDEELQRIFAKDNAEIIAMRNSSKPVFEKINEYIYLYGARTMDELKLETVTLFEDPTFLIDTIKSYLQLDSVPSPIIHNPSDSEKDLLSFFPIHSRAFIKRLVRITKYFVRNRESLRLRRTYIYSIVRNIYLRMGHNFLKENIIDNYRDIFFLNRDEANSIAAGNKCNVEELRNKIHARKEKYNTNKSKTIYERMYFYGEVSPENVLPIYSAQECSDEGIMHGVAGGGKIVEGKVKLVENPENADVTGFILMAKRTDPGWTVLFPMAKAIIIERGSILSHSAVVAREMGITLVAGIRGLTERIKDGMTVRVDGINGTVEIIGKDDE